MKIAVDIRFADEEYEDFIYQTLCILAKQYQQHTFIFISEQPVDLSFKNVVHIFIKSLKKTNFYFHIADDYKISAVLKKNKADIFISTRCVKQFKIPQCLIASTDTKFKYLKRAKLILADSLFLKKYIITKHKIDENKIEIVYPAAAEIFHPISFEERENIKKQYADEAEYFFYLQYSISAEPLINVLKAFSVFKKRQKSSMKLLIKANNIKMLTEHLRLYKFRGDVKIVETVLESGLAQIIAGAYSIIYFNNDTFPLLQAMQCNVPAITNDSGKSFEICSDAALYADTDNHNSISEKMMLIFKDEKFRKKIIEKQREQIKKNSGDKAAVDLWQSIEKAVN